MRLLAGLLLVTLPAAGVAAAQQPAAPDRERHATTGRGPVVRSTMDQTQIATTIDLGRIADAANGGGALGGIIIRSMDTRRKTMVTTLMERAESTVGPLRAALAGMDVQALASATTAAASAALEAHAEDGGGAGGSTAGSAAAARPLPSALAHITYRYELSPDFSQIRVAADLDLAGGVPTGAGRSDRRRVSSIVQLRTRSYEPTENVARWSAANGQLAKSALTLGFAQLEHLIPYAAGLSGSDIAAFTAKGRAKGFAAGFYGAVISQKASDPEDVLLWSDGLVHVQSVS